MTITTTFPVPKIRTLPASFASEGAIRLELQEGIPVLRASSLVQTRIDGLLAKEREQGLSPEECSELESYEDIDDYLSFLNRMTRNLYLEAGNN